MGQVVSFPTLNRPDAPRKPIAGSPYLNQPVRSLAEALAERERSQRTQRDWNEKWRIDL